MTSEDNLRVLRDKAVEARSLRLAATLGGVQPDVDAARMAPVNKMIHGIDATLHGAEPAKPTDV